MHFSTATAVAVLAFASTAVAESPMYKMSTRQLFGVVRRQDNGAYAPEEANCNDGNTCAEACGAGFETCASTDSSIHCFNKAAGQVCCPSDSGNSCEKGYYCAGGSDKAVTCCPEGVSLADCAAGNSVAGGLTSLTAAATTTTTSTTTTSTTITTTTSTTTTTTTSSTTTTTPLAVNTTIYVNSTVSTSCTSTIKGSATFAATNYTTTKGPDSPKPTPASNTTGTKPVPAGANGLAASGLAAIVGVAFAALVL